MQRNISNAIRIIRNNAAFALLLCLVIAMGVLLFSIGPTNSELPKKPSDGQSVPSAVKAF